MLDTRSPAPHHRVVDLRDPSSTARAPAWQAELALRFAAERGRTRLSAQRHRGPLRVQRVLYPEAEGCDALLLHPPGGIADGDRLSIEVALEPGAAALLTTPGASKWYRCDRGAATQQVHLRVADEATLEWLPQEAILFRGADAIQSLTIELAPRAATIGWDIVQLGRIAAGERWDLGRLRQRLDLRRDGTLVWREAADLGADSPLLEAACGFAGRRVFGTLWATSPALAAQADVALDAVRAALAPMLSTPGLHSLPESEQASCCAAATWLAAPVELLLVRALCNDAESVRTALQAAWHALRPLALGRAPRLPRIWAT